MDQYLSAAVKLHQYLVANHWKNEALIGPDPGIRFNYRIGRFIKSYLRGLSWGDDHYYLQAQGYWILGNWLLYTRKGEGKYAEIAVRCSENILAQQRDDGAWVYPNPEWKGRVTTYEGTWAALGLIETYRHTTEHSFLEGACNWHKFQIEKTGFQQIGDELAVNYFANRNAARVPNASADMLRFLAEIGDVTDDKSYLKPACGLLTFLKHVQQPSGELPYAVKGTGGGKVRTHFQCYQYNAFECLNLMRYYELTGNAAVLPLIHKLLNFLRHGQAGDGRVFYACDDNHCEVIYHTAVLGAAFLKASQIDITGYDGLATRAYAYLLKLQCPDGGFPYSRREHLILADRRSYPRQQSMIQYHLLQPEPETQDDVAGNQNEQENKS